MPPALVSGGGPVPPPISCSLAPSPEAGVQWPLPSGQGLSTYLSCSPFLPILPPRTLGTTGREEEETRTELLVWRRDHQRRPWSCVLIQGFPDEFQGVQEKLCNSQVGGSLTFTNISKAKIQGSKTSPVHIQ